MANDMVVSDGTYYYAYDSQSQNIFRAKISDFNGKKPNAGQVTNGGMGEVVSPDKVKATGLSENDYQTLCSANGIYNMSKYNPKDFDGFDVAKASSELSNLGSKGEVSLDDFCDACYQLEAIVKEINAIDIDGIDDDDFEAMEAALKKLAGAEAAFTAVQAVFKESYAGVEGVDGGTKFGGSAIGACTGAVVGIGVCAGVAATGAALSSTGIGAIIGIPLLIGAGIGYLVASGPDIDVDKINNAMKNSDQWTTDLENKRKAMDKKFVSMFDKKMQSYEGNIQKMMSGSDLDFSNIESVSNAFDEMTKMLSTFKDDVMPIMEMAKTYGIDLGAGSSKYKTLLDTLGKDDNKGLTEYGDKYIKSFAEALGAQVTGTGEAIVDTQDLEELAKQVQKFITDVGTNSTTKNLKLNTEPLTKLIEETIKNVNQGSIDDSIDALNDGLSSGEYTYSLPSQEDGGSFDTSGSEYDFNIGDEAAVYSAADATKEGVEGAQNDGEYSNDTGGYDDVKNAAKEKAQKEIDEFVSGISTDGKSISELEELYDSVAKIKEESSAAAESLGVDLSGFDTSLDNIRGAQQKIVDDYLGSKEPQSLEFQPLEDLYKEQEETRAEYAEASSAVDLSGFDDLQVNIRTTQQTIINDSAGATKTDGTFEELASSLNSSVEEMTAFQAINGELDYSAYDAAKQSIQQNQQGIVDNYVQTTECSGLGLPELVSLTGEVNAQLQQYQGLAPELEYSGFDTLLGQIIESEQGVINEYVQNINTNLGAATTVESINTVRQNIQANATYVAGLGLDASSITQLDESAKSKMQGIVNQQALQFTQRASTLEDSNEKQALALEITTYMATLPASDIDTSALVQLVTTLTAPEPEKPQAKEETTSETDAEQKEDDNIAFSGVISLPVSEDDEKVAGEETEADEEASVETENPPADNVSEKEDTSKNELVVETVVPKEDDIMVETEPAPSNTETVETGFDAYTESSAGRVDNPMIETETPLERSAPMSTTSFYEVEKMSDEPDPYFGASNSVTYEYTQETRRKVIVNETESIGGNGVQADVEDAIEIEVEE